MRRSWRPGLATALRLDLQGLDRSTRLLQLAHHVDGGAGDSHSQQHLHRRDVALVRARLDAADVLVLGADDGVEDVALDPLGVALHEGAGARAGSVWGNVAGRRRGQSRVAFINKQR